MFNIDENEKIAILLHELETICIPLKFDSLKLNSKQQDFIVNSEIKVILLILKNNYFLF